MVNQPARMTPIRNSRRSIFETSAITSADPGAVIEGVLLKLSERLGHWNDRYFVLTGNSLSYYRKKGDEHPKATFDVSNVSCKVGNLYIDQRAKGTGSSKELLYCLRISVGDRVVPDDDTTTHQYYHSSAGLEAPRSPGAASRGTVTSHVPNALTPRASGDEGDPLSVPDERSASFSGATRNLRRRSAPSGGEDDFSAPTHTTKANLVPGDDHPFLPSLQDSVAEQSSHKKSLFLEDVTTRTYFEEQQLQERELLRTTFFETLKENKKKSRQKVVQGGKIAVAAGAAVTVGVLTAGVGLLAGLVFLGAGAAAGGTGVMGGAAYQRMKKKGELVIASPSYDEAKRWKNALDACLVSEAVRCTTWGQMFAMEGRSARTALLPREITTVGPPEPASGEMSPPDAVWNSNEGDQPSGVETGSDWVPIEGAWSTLLGTGNHGLRIFREERNAGHTSAILRSKERACPPVKAQVVLNASPLESFLCIMSVARVQTNENDVLWKPNSEQRASFRVIERIDDHTDVIHLFFRPLYLFPSWTSPRDYVLFRYWKYEPDGSYVVCFDSTNHEECPPCGGYTRGVMHSVYTIAPKKKQMQEYSVQQECLLTAVVQVDPRGWIPKRSLPLSWCDAFAVSALLQVLDIRDAIDHDRFVPLSFDTGSIMVQHNRRQSFPLPIETVPPTEEGEDPYSYDFTFASEEFHAEDGRKGSISNNPPPLPLEKWAQPDANSFRVRGKTYKEDKVKINAGSSIGRLVAVDVVRVDEPIYSGLSLHPSERMQVALQREKRLLAKGKPSDLPPFCFIVNIVLPGPPFYHGVFYYAVDDISCVDGTDGTPSSKLCKEFFFGADDGFRDRTFKLIPTIVEGNFVVKRAVGSTPAIMGTKLRQFYVRSSRFFEVILDCGSSSVATGVIRLSLGYAKSLVVDMGFLLEGDDETTLPERVFGCVRMKYPEFGTHLRKVVAASPVMENGSTKEDQNKKY